MGSPAVILKSKFVLPTSTEYKKYVDYIDREDAKVSVEIDRDSQKGDDFTFFHSFMDYMDDEEKLGELFTNTKNSLNDDEKSDLKKQFIEGQKNESPMWQDVISFDNDWLEKQGLYDSNNHTVDEERIRSVVRETMDTMMKSENLKNAVWSASIHYNTDNIHVHIATVQVDSTRERAKRKQSTLNKMKSKVVNQILDRTDDYNRIDDLIRGTVHYKKSEKISFALDEKTSDLFAKAMELLPKDMSQWQYGYNSIDPARPYIDEIVEIYLETYHEDDMKELNKKLDEQVDISKELYGEGSRHEQYKQTKLDDLKKRMGNAVLSEMKQHVYERRRSFKKGKGKSNSSSSDNNKVNHLYNNWKSARGVHFALMRLNYALKKKHRDHEVNRQIDEFDRMMDGYE